MNIETKYPINQELVHIGTVSDYKDCKYCNGTGVVKIKGKKFDCPNCDGKGKTETAVKWIVGDAQYPDRISIEVEEGEKPRISYVFKCGDFPRYYDESDCFPSRAKAQAECNRRNNEYNIRDNN